MSRKEIDWLLAGVVENVWRDLESHRAAGHRD